MPRFLNSDGDDDWDVMRRERHGRRRALSRYLQSGELEDADELAAFGSDTDQTISPEPDDEPNTPRYF